MSRSLVVYRGPSAYHPDTIIRAVLVLRSTNSKTGNMAQLHILPDATPPHTAQQTGEDRAVCGACPLRPSINGGCYVVTCQGPLSVWRATLSQPVAGAGEVAGALLGRTLRLGAYGDPAALPPYVVAWLAGYVNGRVTGYTHGWRARPDLRRYCMASVDAPDDRDEAHAAGWRTFRTHRPGGILDTDEIQCPSERVSCAECLLCRGTTIGARSISIEVHGSRASRALLVVQ